MASEKKPGWIPQATVASTSSEESMVSERTNGMMAQHTRVNGTRIRSTEQASTLGQMVAVTRENGEKIIWRASASTPGATVGTIKVSTSTTKSMGTVSTRGRTQDNTLDIGNQESSMVQVSMQSPKIQSQNMASGKTARGSSGSAKNHKKRSIMGNQITLNISKTMRACSKLYQMPLSFLLQISSRNLMN